jgi:phage shock protein PspC (stress-responsive transcriptional regulator)/predicted membrane protein
MMSTMTTESEPRRLYREPDDRKVAGVCSGIGDYLGVDPTVVRLAVVVIALSSTWVGVGMYIIASIVVSERPADVPRVRSPRPLLPESSTTPVILALLLLAGVALVRGFGWFDAPFVAFGFLALGAWLLLRDNDRDTDTNITQSVTAGTASATTLAGEAAPERDIPSKSGYALGDAGDTTQDDDHATRIESSVTEVSALSAGPQGEVPPPVPPWGLGSRSTLSEPPEPRRDSSPAVTLGVLCVAAGVIALLTLFDVLSFGITTTVAALLVVIGIVMVAGAWRGRTRWLIALGIPAIGLLILDESLNVPLSAGVGERSVIVDLEGADTRHQELTVGELTLDLRHVDDSDGEPVKIVGELGMGELIVIVPDDMTAKVDAHVQFGVIETFGSDGDNGGTDVDREFTIERDEDTPERKARTVELDLEVGMGQVTIEHG